MRRKFSRNDTVTIRFKETELNSTTHDKVKRKDLINLIPQMEGNSLTC